MSRLLRSPPSGLLCHPCVAHPNVWEGVLALAPDDGVRAGRDHGHADDGAHCRQQVQGGDSQKQDRACQAGPHFGPPVLSARCRGQCAEMAGRQPAHRWSVWWTPAAPRKSPPAARCRWPSWRTACLQVGAGRVSKGVRGRAHAWQLCGCEAGAHSGGRAASNTHRMRKCLGCSGTQRASQCPFAQCPPRQRLRGGSRWMAGVVRGLRQSMRAAVPPACAACGLKAQAVQLKLHASRLLLFEGSAASQPGRHLTHEDRASKLAYRRHYQRLLHRQRLGAWRGGPEGIGERGQAELGKRDARCVQPGAAGRAVWVADCKAGARAGRAAKHANRVPASQDGSPTLLPKALATSFAPMPAGQVSVKRQLRCAGA